MKKTIFFVFALMNICIGLVFGQEPATFDEARTLSKELGKPLLMEFVRED